MQRDFLSIRALPILALFAAFLSTPAFAQFQARPDPAEAGRSAPAVEYQSVFSGYQPFREQKGNVWKEVNREVADNPGMGPIHSMKGMSGKGMAGMDDKAQKGDMAGMAGHGGMAMPKSQSSAAGKGMAGMDHKANPGGMAGMPGHGAMGSGGRQAAEPTGPAGKHSAAEGHGSMAMAAPQSPGGRCGRAWVPPQ